MNTQSKDNEKSSSCSLNAFLNGNFNLIMAVSMLSMISLKYVYIQVTVTVLEMAQKEFYLNITSHDKNHVQQLFRCVDEKKTSKDKNLCYWKS